MTTGQVYANVVARKLLGYREFSTMLDYMRDLATYSFSKMWERDGTFVDPWALAADGNDKFKITGSVLGTDGQGHLIDLAEGVHEGIQFENTAAVNYSVGLKYAVKPWEGNGVDEPDGIQVNSDTGDPEYLRWEETYGESGAPDFVADLGTAIQLTIDGIAELGVSHAGREAVVWLVDPEGATQAIAIEHCTVQWTGSNNKITTSGLLGQSTVSINVADYRVVLLGPTVKAGFSLENSSEHLFVGTVTGSGAGTPPSVFSTVGQTNHTASLANLSDVTRLEPFNDRLKIDVKAGTGESAIDQIRVTDQFGNYRFQVNEAGDVAVKNAGGVDQFTVDSATGDVVIQGDLLVQGQTTQNDVVQINSDATVTDNLTAGDSDLDSHQIKGSWTHKKDDDSVTFFAIDASTGRVGIGQAPGTYTLEVNGGVNFKYSLDVDGDLWVGGNYDMDGVVLCDWIANNSSQKLGSSTARWGDVYGTNANFIKIALSTVDGDGFTTTAKPATSAAYDLGSTSRNWKNIYLSQGVISNGDSFMDYVEAYEIYTEILTIGAGGGVGGHLVPTADNSYDLGSATNEWRNLYVDGTANIDTLTLSSAAGEGLAATLVPDLDGVRNIGTDAYRFYRVTARQTFRVYDLGSSVTPPHFQTDVLWYMSGDQSASYNKVTLGTNTGGGAYGKYGYTAEMFNLSLFAQARVAGFRSYVEQSSGASGAITNAVGFYSRARCNDAAGITNVKHFEVEDVDVDAGSVTNQYGLYVPNLVGAAINYGIYCDNGVSCRFDTLVFDDDRSGVDNWAQGEWFKQAKANQPSYILWGLGMRQEDTGPYHQIRIEKGAFFCNGKTTIVESDVVVDVTSGTFLDTWAGADTDWVFVFVNDDGNVVFSVDAPAKGTGYLSTGATPQSGKDRRDYVFVGSILYDNVNSTYVPFVRFGDLVFYDNADGRIGSYNWNDVTTDGSRREKNILLTYDPCYIPTDVNENTSAVGIIVDVTQGNVVYGTGVTDYYSEVVVFHGRGTTARAGRVVTDPGSDWGVASNLQVMLEFEGTGAAYFSFRGTNINGTGGSPTRLVEVKLNGYIEPLNRIGVSMLGPNML